MLTTLDAAHEAKGGSMQIITMYVVQQVYMLLLM